MDGSGPALTSTLPAPAPHHTAGCAAGAAGGAGGPARGGGGGRAAPAGRPWRVGRRARAGGGAARGRAGGCRRRGGLLAALPAVRAQGGGRAGCRGRPARPQLCFGCRRPAPDRNTLPPPPLPCRQVPHRGAAADDERGSGAHAAPRAVGRRRRAVRRHGPPRAHVCRGAWGGWEGGLSAGPRACVGGRGTGGWVHRSCRPRQPLLPARPAPRRVHPRAHHPRAQAYNKRATVAYLQQRYHDAIQDCKTALAMNPWCAGWPARPARPGWASLPTRWRRAACGVRPR